MKLINLLFIIFFSLNTGIAQKKLTIERLPNSINSPNDETNTSLFGESVMYFSSTVKDTCLIYRTELIKDDWIEGGIPLVFEKETLNLKYGCFTPNKKTFYCSACEGNPDDCQWSIYVMYRKPSSWTRLTKLPANINLKNTSNQDPYIFVKDGTETLYFTSDRADGVGGKDLWYAIKTADKDTFLFENSVNLGAIINTPKDEISPFFEEKTGLFYFSSNGQINNIGGYDIYKTKGKETKWIVPTRLKSPINSSADDIYFFYKKGNGLFSSNRKDKARKDNQTDYDLYHLEMKEEERTLQGTIFNQKRPNKLVKNSLVTLYEISNGSEFVINTLVTPDGNYSFTFPINYDYLIKIKHTNFVDTSFLIKMNFDSLQSKEIRNFPLRPHNYVRLKGNIQDENNQNSLIKNVSVAIYKKDNEDLTLIVKRILNQGNFELNLRQNQQHKIVCRKKNFYPKTFFFTTTKTDEIAEMIINFPLQEVNRTKNMELKGSVFNEITHEPISNVKYTIMEILENGKLIQKDEGEIVDNYSLILEKFKKYKIKLSHEKYESIAFLVDITDEKRAEMYMDFYMFSAE